MIRWIGLVVVTLCIAGCGSMPPSYGPGKNHYRLTGERVEIRLITYDQWERTYSAFLAEKAGVNKIDLPPRPEAGAWLPVGPGSSDRAVGEAEVSALLATIAGAAIDAVKAAIEAEAKTHEQQYRQSVSADDFWEGGRPRYAAFEVVRFVDSATKGQKEGQKTQGQKDVAARQVFALVYSQYDPRIIHVRPIFVSVPLAKAKVSRSAGAQRLAVRSDIVVDSSWVNTGKDGLELKSTSLGAGPIRVGGYGLSESDPAVWHATWNPGTQSGSAPDEPAEQDWPWTGRLAGLSTVRFLAPQPSSDRVSAFNEEAIKEVYRARAALAAIEAQLARTDLPPRARTEFEGQHRTQAQKLRTLMAPFSGGAFTLSVIVTESDQSKVAERLLRVAEFVGSQRDTVVELIKEQ